MKTVSCVDVPWTVKRKLLLVIVEEDAAPAPDAAPPPCAAVLGVAAPVVGVLPCPAPPPPPPPWLLGALNLLGLGAGRVGVRSAATVLSSDRASRVCSMMSRPAWIWRNCISTAT